MNDSKKMYDEYAIQLNTIEGIESEEKSDQDGSFWTFTSPKPQSLKVELRLWKRGADFVALTIEGVDCGYWHTAEEKTLDYHMELAKAALRGDVVSNRSPILRLKEVCFKVGDNWECTLTDNAWSYHYVKTRKRLKGSGSTLSNKDLKATLEKIKSSMPDDIRKAHTRCSGHPEDIQGSKLCGCFYCLETFSPDKIEEWVDEGRTPICPFCGIDSVLGDKSGYPITEEFLSEMHRHWFEGDGVALANS